MPDREAVSGTCHCEAVRVAVALSKPAADIAVRACQCGFCRRQDARMFTDADGLATITAPAHGLQRYRLGHGVTDFLICRTCGVFVAAVSEISGALYATVNARGLQIAAFADRAAAPVDYEGEQTEGRLSRRETAWTPARVIEAAA